MFKKVMLLCATVFVSSLAVQALDASAIPNRLKKAGKGEWVVYSSMGGLSQKQTITEIEEKEGDKVFSVKTELIVEGQTMQSMDNQFSLNQSIKEQEAMVIDPEQMTVSQGKETVKGREIDVVILESQEDGQTVKTYLSEAIPVSGIVKIEVNGEALMEVQDFGE